MNNIDQSTSWFEITGKYFAYIKRDCFWREALSISTNSNAIEVLMITTNHSN